MKFERRRMIIRSIINKDVEDFCYQTENFGSLSKQQRSSKVNELKSIIKKIPNDISSKLMLAVEERDTAKLIGFIDIERKENTKIILVTVLIPNEVRLVKYGYDVIDQLRKICQENWHDIKILELNRDCEATKIYLKQKGIDTEYITVA